MDQVSGPSTVGASGTPKRFWLWSKYGPSGPLPAPGHANPRPSFHFYFPGCKMPLAIRAGGVCFFSLIFTHKMCISRTKAVMMGPLVSANFLPVLSGNSCATSIRCTVIPFLQRHLLYTETDTTVYHIAGESYFNWGDFKGTVLH